MGRTSKLLSPEEVERRRLYNKEYMRRTRGSSGLGRAAGHKAPDDVLQERDRRLSVVPTLGQLYLGDPAPGRSALDRQRAKA